MAVSTKKLGTGKMPRGGTYSGGSFGFQASASLIGFDIDIDDAYFSLFNEIDSNITNIGSALTFVSSDVTHVVSTLTDIYSDTVEIKNNSGPIFSLWTDTNVESGAANLAIINTWQQRFLHGKSDTKPYKDTIAETVYEKFSDKVVKLEKYLTDNKFEGNGCDWLYKYYHPSGGSVSGTDFNNVYQGIRNNYLNLLSFLSSTENFIVYGSTSLTCKPWSVFEKAVSAKIDDLGSFFGAADNWNSSSSVNGLISLKKIASELEYLKVRADYIPSNLQGQLGNIGNSAQGAASNANAAAGYSQQNNGLLQQLVSKVDNLSMTLDGVKATVENILEKYNELIEVELPSYYDQITDEFLMDIRRDASAAAEGVGTAVRNTNVLIGDVAAVKTDVGTVKTDVAAVKTDVGTVKTDVAAVKTDVGTVKTDVAAVKKDVGTVKMDVAAVKKDVSDTKKKIEDLENNLNKIAAWVVHCICSVISKILVPFQKCFDGDVNSVEPSDNLPAIVEGVEFGVVDVENLVFKCPDVVGFWPYWPVYEEEKTSETSRFVSEDIGGALAFYYYPLG